MACSARCDVTWTARVRSIWESGLSDVDAARAWTQSQTRAPVTGSTGYWKVQPEKEETTPPPPHPPLLLPPEGQQSATAEERNSNTSCHLTNTRSAPDVCVCFLYTHCFHSVVLLYRRLALQLFWVSFLNGGRVTRNIFVLLLVSPLHLSLSIFREYFLFRLGDYSSANNNSSISTESSYNTSYCHGILRWKYFCMELSRPTWGKRVISILVQLVGTLVSVIRLFSAPGVFLWTPSSPGCPGSSPSFQPQTSPLVPVHSLEVVLSLQAHSLGDTSPLWQVWNPSCSTPWRETSV